MNISNHTTSPSGYAACMPNAFKQATADFELLAQALPSGDLAVARQAFTALQHDSPWVSRAMSAPDAANETADTAVCRRGGC